MPGTRGDSSTALGMTFLLEDSACAGHAGRFLDSARNDVSAKC